MHSTLAAMQFASLFIFNGNKEKVNDPKLNCWFTFSYYMTGHSVEKTKPFDKKLKCRETEKEMYDKHEIKTNVCANAW